MKNILLLLTFLIIGVSSYSQSCCCTNEGDFCLMNITYTVDYDCDGGAADIILTVTGETPPYTYTWSNGAQTGVGRLNGVLPGTYSVTVRDSTNCTVTNSLLVVQPNNVINITGVVTNASCTTSGAIDATVSGGVSPYSYNWTNGGTVATIQDISSIGAGTYVLNVTDAVGCTASKSFTITDVGGLPTLSTSTTAASCTTNGTATVSTSATTILWSTGANTNTINAPAGTYTVTVTTNTGCSNSASVTIADGGGTLILDSADIFPEVCGNSNGSIGGIKTPQVGLLLPLVYTWGDGYTGPYRGGLAAGTYTLTVSDQRGCTGTGSYVVPSVDGEIVLTTYPRANCGPQGGAIMLHATGGTPPYVIEWSNGYRAEVTSTNSDNVDRYPEDLQGIIEGTYTVTVTDATGCSATASQGIIDRTPPSISFAGPYNVCPGESTVIPLTYNLGSNASFMQVFVKRGGISLTLPQAPGAEPIGSGQIVYSGENIDFQVNSSLSPGTYEVTVSNNWGCKYVTSFEVTGTGCNTCGYCSGCSAIITPSSCGLATGAITLTTGTTNWAYPVSYSWSDGVVAGNVRTNLAAGSYTAIVTQNNGCKDYFTYTVGDDGADLPVSFTKTNAGCTAGGSIDITTTVTQPVTYAWSDGATTQDRFGLAPGTYVVTVTEPISGCDAVKSIVVSDNTGGLTGTVSTNPTNCAGNTGSATITMTSGTAPYTYVWSNNSTSSTATGLAAGLVTVVVTDAVGCTNSFNGTIGSGGSSIALTYVVTPSNCGANDGGVNVSISGGSSPYSYSWSNGSTSQDISNVAAGTYTLNVVDANGCTATGTYTINNVSPTIGITGVTTPEKCTSMGSITATITGTGPFTYLWNDGVSTKDRTGLVAGTYTLTVSKNGCSANETFTVTDNTSAPSVSCSVNGTYGIDVTVTGTGPFTYLWSDGSTIEDRVTMPNGIYTIVVTDANGCIASCEAIVDINCDLQVTATSVNANCGNANGSISLATTSSGMPVTYLWNNGSTNSNRTGLDVGNYSVVITDGLGCTISRTYTIGNSGIDAQLVTTPITCNGGDGALTVQINAGTQPITYLWNDGNTSQTRTALGPGSYNVTATDANGCSKALTAVLNYNAMSLSLVGTDATCNLSNGAVNLTVSGGTGPYTILWSTAKTTEDINNLPEGTYTVTVTDAENCTKTSSVSISNLSAPILEIADINICLGESTTVVTGLSGDHEWFNGNTVIGDDPTIVLTPTQTTMYNVEITDVNNCLITEDFSVNVNPGQILVRLFNDLNGNGIENNGEGGLSGVKVTIYNTSDEILSTQYSNANGEVYFFYPIGNYYIIVEKAGFGFGPVTGDNVVGFNGRYDFVNECNDIEILGGLFGGGSISGLAFLDNNGNGVRDNADELIDVAVYITKAADNNVFAGTTTMIGMQGGVLNDQDATYQFNGLTPGTYIVRFQDLASYSFTTGNVGNDDSIDSDVVGEGLVNMVSAASFNAGYTQTVTVTSANNTANVDAGYTCTGQSAVTLSILPSTVTQTCGATKITFGGTFDATSVCPVCCDAYGINIRQWYKLNNGNRTFGATSTITCDISNNITFADVNIPLWILNQGDVITIGFDVVGINQNQNCTYEGASSFIVATETYTGLAASIEGNLNVCVGASTTLTAQPPGSTYAWSTGATTQSITVSPGGPTAYTVTVTQGGCSQPVTELVTTGSPQAVITADRCGLFRVTVSGACDVASIKWYRDDADIFQNGETLLTTTAGSYKAVVQCNNSCVDEITSNVVSYGGWTLSASATDASCGDMTGTASVTASGNGGPYTYAWSNGGTTPTIAGLTPAFYTVTVTNTANKCTQSRLVTVGPGNDDCATVIGQVFEDMVRSSIIDSEDPGIRSVTVQLVNDSSGLVVSSALTNIDGRYVINTTPGTYFIRVIAPSGYFTTIYGGNAANVSNVALLTSESAPFVINNGDLQVVNAGYYKTGSIGDQLWLEVGPINGKFDVNDIPFTQGTKVELLNGSDSLIASTTINAQGLYYFYNLPPGNYKIYVPLDQPGWDPNFKPTIQYAGTNDDYDSDIDDTGITAVIIVKSGVYYDNIDAGFLDFDAYTNPNISLTRNIGYSPECRTNGDQLSYPDNSLEPTGEGRCLLEAMWMDCMDFGSTEWEVTWPGYLPGVGGTTTTGYQRHYFNNSQSCAEGTPLGIKGWPGVVVKHIPTNTVVTGTLCYGNAGGYKYAMKEQVLIYCHISSSSDHEVWALDDNCNYYDANLNNESFVWHECCGVADESQKCWDYAYLLRDPGSNIMQGSNKRFVFVPD